MSLIIFILVCLGATNIIVFGSIFERPRNYIDRVFHYSLFNKLLQCTTCMGFWVGLLVSFLYDFDINFFFAGCISSICNTIYTKLENLI